MRTPATVAPVKANPQAVQDIKAILSDLSDEQIATSLEKNGNDKVATLKLLLGANGQTCSQGYQQAPYIPQQQSSSQGYQQAPCTPQGQPHYYHPGQNVQYNVPNYPPPHYYQPHPEMGKAGGDRRRGSVKEKGWWDENTEGMGFGSGLLMGGLGGVTTFLIGDAIF